MRCKLPLTPVSYLQHLERIGSEDYVVTDEDLLQCRLETIGVEETSFKVNKLELRMIDVSGARGQRYRWTSYFDDANVIAFVCDTSDWEHLGESLALFKTIGNIESLHKADLLIVLNKVDLLYKRVKKDDRRSKYFKADTFEDILGEIKLHFKNAHHAARRGTATTIFQSVAHDRKSVDAIVVAVAEQILRRYAL